MQRYFDRDLSDLAYVRRIAAEGANDRVPLLERLNFLHIAACVLDEFVAVRLPLVDAARREEICTGITEQRCALLNAVEAALRECGAVGLRTDDGRDGGRTAERAGLDAAFARELLPALTPLVVDAEHPFPRLAHGASAVLLELAPEGGDAPAAPLIVPMPPALDTHVAVPDEQGEPHWWRVDTLLRCCAEQLVPGHRIASIALVRVLRANDLKLAEGFHSLRAEVARGIESRPNNEVVCLEVDEDAPPRLVQFLTEQLMRDEKACFVCRLPWRAIDATAGWRRIAGADPRLAGERFAPHEPLPLPQLERFDGDLLAAMEAGDFLLHSPYHAFEGLSRLLWQAAADPDVVAIRQTLYRTDESVVAPLLEAARRGKDVTVIVELEARENERHNIELSHALETAGAHIVHGIVGLKVHAKLLLIVRRDGRGLREYGVFSTGNFHPGNAATYSDLTLFTADEALTADLRRLMNYITGHLSSPSTTRLLVAPAGLRDALITHIEQEARNARAGRPSGIWLKVNSLLDPRIIDALYAAAADGVPIRAVVRRHCALRPGLEGLSSTITVSSLIGRFLEHARLVCFANGTALPSADARVFLGSADWMSRNFDERVEVLVPVDAPALRAQLQAHVMALNLADTAQSWELGPDGDYERQAPTGRSAQMVFITDPLGDRDAGPERRDTTTEASPAAGAGGGVISLHRRVKR
jgi:polyphosphate kinase